MSSEPQSGNRSGNARRKDPYAQQIRDDLCRVYVDQGARTPLMALLSIAILVWILYGTVPTQWLAGWATLAAAFVSLRWVLCIAYSRADAPREKQLLRMRVIVVLRIAGGLLVGGAAPVWFPAMSLYQQMLFMIVCLGWYATTLIVSLASPVSGLLFGLTLMGPIALAWGLNHGVGDFLVVLLIAALLLLLRQSTENAHAVMRAAIRSRLREEDLARGLEQQRSELEAAMRAKSRFLAAASHDLRQPVTSMNLLLSALTASRDEASVRNVAAKFAAPLQALEEILSTLLEVSRLEAGIVEVNLRDCDIREVVSPVVAEYTPRAAAKRVKLETSVPDFALRTDPDLVRRVLRNLIDNALKFTDTGSVRVEARRELPDNLVLTVSDTGRGIPREQQRWVFDDYFQGDNPQRDRRQGLGLGLSIVRRLLVLLGGKVTVSSQPDLGSRFEVRLPNAIRDFARDRAKVAEPAPVGARLDVSRVLVVEDDRLVVDAMSTLLRSLGVEARYALDAEDAMRQTSLGRFIPDLALVDIGLPGSIDGIALVQTLRPRLPRCAFLLVTGDTRPEVIRRATDAGIAILHKPISIERLNEKLKGLRTSA